MLIYTIVVLVARHDSDVALVHVGTVLVMCCCNPVLYTMTSREFINLFKSEPKKEPDNT